MATHDNQKTIRKRKPPILHMITRKFSNQVRNIFPPVLSYTWHASLYLLYIHPFINRKRKKATNISQTCMCASRTCFKNLENTILELGWIETKKVAHRFNSKRQLCWLAAWMWVVNSIVISKPKRLILCKATQEKSQFRGNNAYDATVMWSWTTIDYITWEQKLVWFMCAGGFASGNFTHILLIVDQNKNKQSEMLRHGIVHDNYFYSV